MDKWTGELIGKMHNNCVTFDDLAQKLGLTKGYVSMILHCKRTPANAKERFETALEEIIKERTVTNDRVTGI